MQESRLLAIVTTLDANSHILEQGEPNFGIDPTFLLQRTQSNGPATSAPIDPRENKLAEMVAVVVADTEDAWHAIFAANSRGYEEPALVLFTGGGSLGMRHGPGCDSPTRRWLLYSADQRFPGNGVKRPSGIDALSDRYWPGSACCYHRKAAAQRQ